ncbi:MAG TPA: hypothetical protein PK231_00420 [Acidocella sp.]|uniref:hypothetical protein n=1 Tax=Acidiphilium sp. 20-67-58 TaxID=1970291 RepID=UPI0025B9A95B|nr:hypothetical protein [Acidiphilium sp. 20-67-58]HQT37855.1 hypothetical protein [Acidocella sp.]
MNYLGQNWLLIALVFAAFLFMMRRGGCGIRRRHSYQRGRNDEQPNTPPPSVDSHDGINGMAIDPVSGHAVSMTAAAASSVYQGQVFFFENRANRDSFEAVPEQYASNAVASGIPVGSYGVQRRRHHGC